MQHQQPPQPQMMQLANITTEQIQKCLDDNKQLIMTILEYQNLGKAAESASFQAQLQHNLTYLAKIADAQPHSSSAPQAADKLLQMSSQPVKQQEQYVQPAQLGAQQQGGLPISKLPFQSNSQQQSPVLFQQQQQVLQEQMGIRDGNMYHGMHAGFGNNFMSMQQQGNTFDNSDDAASLQEHNNRVS